MLDARVVERGAMRTTPAGLPALDLVLKHESTLAEAGMPRRVSMELRAVAIGPIAERVSAIAVGDAARFEGFVGAQRNGRGLLFHLLSFDETVAPPSSGSN